MTTQMSPFPHTVLLILLKFLHHCFFHIGKDISVLNGLFSETLVFEIRLFFPKTVQNWGA